MFVFVIKTKKRDRFLAYLFFKLDVYSAVSARNYCVLAFGERLANYGSDATSRQRINPNLPH